MSLIIIKQGILDSIQDCGRFGLQHAGINPNGSMDSFASRMANAILGKELTAPVFEFHFPAAQIQFRKETIVCICGGDFSPAINNQPIPQNHPIAVAKNSILTFRKLISGNRCYMSMISGPDVKKWMNSYSTNIKAAAGGWKGRQLKKGDQINYRDDLNFSNLLHQKDFIILPWKAADVEKPEINIEFIKGSEWNWLTTEAQFSFQEGLFQVSIEADRMGYRLTGKPMQLRITEQLVSSPVSFGTVQLLPNGNMIILMADHQTTGGYPRIAHVISAHLPLLAQKKTNDVIQFKLTDLASAEQKIIEQEKYLHYLQDACKFKIENILHGSM
ncbi:MAG TPA: biotin-dependent carboxyltransferase family protein [Flavisolibacter sp.]|nr:biotin-dependent carboxyltransferase family protein [Flavisolibacter sp.]